MNHFQNRSEAAQEIISRRPGFIERWALLVFLGVLLLLFSGAWFLHYPDIIETKGVLMADNGPKEIVPGQTGRLIRIFVANGSEVQQGQVIGWLESTANTADVLTLSTLIDSCTTLLREGKDARVPALFGGHIQNIGSLQASYQTFISALQSFNDYLVNGYYPRQKSIIEGDIASLEAMDSSLLEEKKLFQQDKDLSTTSFDVSGQLYQEKVLSAEDYRTEQSKLIGKQMAIPQINTNILSNLNQKRDKIKELEQLNHDAAQQKSVFDQALQTLRSNVNDWVHQYVIRAPLRGTIAFTVAIQENQYVEQGKVLGYVNPAGSRFYTQVFLPQANLGRVNVGLPVQLRFAAYPYQEVGFLKGRLEYISRIVSDSGFLATVRLENGLKTNLGNYIQYKEGLTADAVIVTNDKSLLQRVYFNLVHMSSVGK
jgi:HlyD family secretion protein